MSCKSVATAILACFLMLGALAFGQSDNANVNGLVLDPSGSALPEAKVTLRNEATGLTREVFTNASGRYSIPTVPPGTYTYSVEAPGFKKFESTGNKIDPSVPANLSATLSVGAVTETVEVSATATQLQTESGALGKVVEGKQIVVNRSQMAGPSTDPLSTNFGKVTSQTSATNRWIQAQARITF